MAARLSWAVRPLNLVDLLAILPVFPFLRSLRILRILRLLTHIAFTRKLFRYFDPFAAAGQTLRTNQLLYLFVASFVVMTIMLGAALGFVAEHRVNERFESPFDAIWWATVTVTTVGYGDKYPNTPTGRLIGMALMGSGFFLFALLAGVVSQTFSHSLLRIREEGIRMTAMVNHIIICGWNRHSPMLLHELRAQSEDIARRVVVFADREPPETLPAWATFVKGDPTQEVELA
jgi:voltage-gated potassium channel